MAFEAPIADNVKTEESIYVSAFGNFHLAVVDFDEDGMRLGPKENNRGDMVALCEVLAGPDGANQEGLQIKIYLSKNTNVLWKMHRFATAIGIVTLKELDDLKKAGKSPIYEFERDAVGKQFFAEVAPNEYNGRTTPRIEGNMFHPTAAQCRDPKRWPRNLPMLKKIGIDLTPQTAHQNDKKDSGKKSASTHGSPASAIVDDALAGL